MSSSANTARSPSEPSGSIANRLIRWAIVSQMISSDSSGLIDATVGKHDVLRSHARRLPVLPEDDPTRSGRVAGRHVEAGVSGVGATAAVDDHVVEQPGRQAPQIAQLFDRAVCVDGEQPAVERGRHQHPPVGQRTEARRAAGNIRDDVDRPVEPDRLELVGVDV